MKKFPKIRFQEFTTKWASIKLNELLIASNKRNYELEFDKTDVLSVSGEFGVVNQIEHKGRSFAGSSVANYPVVLTGHVIYTKSPLKKFPYGIIKKNNGKPGIVSTLYSVFSCKESVVGEFLDYYFQLPDHTNKYLRPLVHKGAKNDMKISNSRFLVDSIYVPDLVEQQKICDCLTTVDKKIQHLTHKKELLEQYKKGVMQKIFSREIRFKDENGKDFPDWEKRKFNEVLFEHKLKSTGHEEVYSVSVHKGLMALDPIVWTA